PPPATTTQTPPPDTSAPSVTLGAPKLAGTTSVTLTLGCPGGESSCAGTVTLQTASAVAARAAKKHKPKKVVLTLGSARFSVSGGRSAAVKVKLSSAARRLLAKGRVKAKLIVRVHDAAGNERTSTRAITLKPPPRKKHKR
ncbi:MAG TPA: hypothetical protein VFV85_09415, partial [Conexibacter sp.]|nr:hypothetical protein [Conexibacter sp.]